MNDTMATKDGPLDPRLNWAALSQAERDAAYDNNAAVKNSAALIAERNRASETLRASRKSFLDVPYGDHERTKIDLYPAADKTAPCLVFLHGGYWQRNSREVFAMLVEGVAAHGWSVAIPGYSLAPDASLTEIVTEISQSLDWLAKNGDVIRHLRARRTLGLVGRRPPRRNGARSPARHRRTGDFRRVRSCADPRYRAEQCAEADRPGSRKACRRFACPPSTSGSTSPTARPNCRRWFSIQSSFMNRAWPRARPASSSRSKAQTISASSANCGVLTARLSISPESSSDSSCLGHRRLDRRRRRSRPDRR